MNTNEGDRTLVFAPLGGFVWRSNAIDSGLESDPCMSDYLQVWIQRILIEFGTSIGLRWPIYIHRPESTSLRVLVMVAYDKPCPVLLSFIYLRSSFYTQNLIGISSSSEGWYSSKGHRLIRFLLWIKFVSCYISVPNHPDLG